VFRRVLIVVLLSIGSLLAQTSVNAGSSSSPTSNQTASSAKPKISPEKETDIRKLLDLMDVAKLMSQTMDGMQSQIRPTLTASLPPGEYRNKLIDLFFERFRAKADPQQMVDMAVAIYDKHFTDNDIKGLIKFYETPLGKKTISALPEVTAELEQQGGEWGQKLGRESMQEVLAEHPDLADALKSAAAATKLP
jgi:hypothetical protein